MANSDLDRRFGGIAKLYGDKGLQKLSESHVCVIGIGGVGSWVAESLARSAVGAITLIDLDVVSESNINRQLVAMEDQIGRDKTAVMKERIGQINPVCKVGIIDEFIDKQNIFTLINKQFDYVVDCIDDFRTKAALIAHCRSSKIKIVTLGGAGGQVDPSRIRQTDLSKTQHDVLLAKTRKLLRQEYRFPKNLKRTFGIPCVYSDEQLIYPDGKGGLSKQKPATDPNQAESNALNCAGGIGSITHVTGAFAFIATAHVLNTLVSNV